MKFLLATVTAAALATSATAGTVTFDAPVEPDVIVVEDPGSMGGSGVWLIPLLAIGLIALAVSSNNDSPPTNGAALQ